MNSHIKIESVLNEQTSVLIYEYLKFADKKCKAILDIDPDSYNDWEHGAYNDINVPDVFCKYSDLLIETLMILVQPHVEQETGLTLVPTYSYCRLYTTGSELPKHKDRDECEISVSLCLGYEGNPWPIYIEGTPVYMEAGDMIIYRGIEVEHWREPLEGTNHAQAFLHYNDVNGPFGKTHIYDGRKFIGMPGILGKILE